MMRVKESRFWQTMRPHLQRYGKFTRIETSTELGVPDVHGLVQGRSFWLELKVVDGLKVKFQDGQIPWMADCRKHGGFCYVFVRKGDQTYLYSSDDATLLGQAGGVHNAVPLLSSDNRGFPYENALQLIVSEIDASLQNPAP